MASEQPANGATNGAPDFTIKAGLAQMLKGGVIMDVVNAEQVDALSPLRIEEAT
jgi:pyridoxal 5'-phosphate synthase pdxS subunit